MLLRAGTFNVSAFRKDIPEAIKREVFKRDGVPAGAKGYHIDHRPPLCDRDLDLNANGPGKWDFVPPQHSVVHLEAIDEAEHQRRTTGRTPGAAKTVTTRGSDVGERARTRDIRSSEAAHREAMERKARGEAKPPSRWGKRTFNRRA
jgi:hypothetical protein